MLERLTRQAAEEGQENWEAGAQSNFMIAAARLGLRVASAANLGQDVYGSFLTSILKVGKLLSHALPHQMGFLSPGHGALLSVADLLISIQENCHSFSLSLLLCVRFHKERDRLLN